MADAIADAIKLGNESAILYEYEYIPGTLIRYCTMVEGLVDSENMAYQIPSIHVPYSYTRTWTFTGAVYTGTRPPVR